MSSTTGYRSPVRLDIGQTPISTDPELFEELTSVYNSIHLLNSYLDQLRSIAEGGSGGGSEQTPAESMPFNRLFVGIALQSIVQGEIVSPSSVSGQNGIVKGVLANNFASTNPTSNFTGVALNSATAGQEVRVGIGPAVLEFPAAVTSQVLYAFSSRNIAGVEVGIGTLFVGNPGTVNVGGATVYPMPVATCPKNGFALFGQYIAR